MASFTPNKGLAQPTVSGDTNVWGTYLDTNFQILDSNLGGTATINCAGSANVTASVSQAQNLVQNLTGVLTGSIDYILPAVGSLYIIDNQTTGAFDVTVITSAAGSSGWTVPQNSTMILYSDGTNIYEATSAFLTTNAAAIVYLSIADAATTYLSIADAATTYLALAGGTITGALHVGAGLTVGVGLTVSAGGFQVTGLAEIYTGANVSGATLNVSAGAGFAGLTATTPGTGDAFALFQYLNASNPVGSIMTNGTTTSFNTTSDARLKIDEGAISAAQAGKIIDRLTPRWFRWKNRDGDAEPGFFAQQVHRVFPWAVTKGGRINRKFWRPWQMDQSKLMPVVIAELQALRARVKELERK